MISLFKRLFSKKKVEQSVSVSIEEPKVNFKEFRNSLPVQEPVKETYELRYEISREKNQSIKNNVLDIFKIEEVPLRYKEILIIYRKQYNENVRTSSLDKVLNVLKREGIIVGTAVEKKRFVWHLTTK